MGGDIFLNLVRSFGFVLDNIVYSLIPIIYKLFIYLSEINLFSMDDTPLGKLMRRIYIFLGIFMLFKVTFSLIQYLIDPNAFSDKSKGFGKLVTNAMVTILLLVSVPYIFDFAMELQTKIVTSNAIGTLIMGNTAGNVVQNDDTVDKNTASLNANRVNEMATDVQFLMYGAFFSINPEAKIGNDPDPTNPEINNVCAETPIFGTVEMARNENGCLDVLFNEFQDENNDMAKYNVTLQDFFKTAESKDPKTINTTRNFSKFDKLLWWTDDDGQYVINYLPFVSAAAGLYVVFLLVSFSVDIAVRVIKLCFLEMIAPIAIVSYIDPKETISNSKLRNWIKESLTTYFSLFLRLATLFLVMVLISTIAGGILAQNGYISGQVNDNEYNIWIYLFLIIGAFMFAKKVPQMIESIFGIKMSGELSLNPFKSVGVTAGLGSMVGSAIGGFAAYNEGKANGEKGLRSALSAVGGAASGFTRGAIGGGKGASDGNWLKNAVRTGGDIAFSKEARREGGPFGTFRSTLAGAAGMPYAIDRYDKEIAIRQNVIDQAKFVKSTSEDFVAKKSRDYHELENQIKLAKQNGTSFTYNGVTYNGSDALSMTDADQALIDLQKQQAKEFASTGMIGNDDFRDDADYLEVKATIEGARQYTQEYKDIAGIQQVTDYESLMDAKDAASTTNTNLKQTKAYDDAKKQKEMRQKYARNDWVNERRK